MNDTVDLIPWIIRWRATQRQHRPSLLLRFIRFLAKVAFVSVFTLMGLALAYAATSWLLWRFSNLAW